MRLEDMSYKVEVTEKRDPIKPLEASKSSIKDFLSDLLNEARGFKQQITLKVMLKNTSQMKKLDLDQFIYFNSTTKTVINHKSNLENAFQEILYWISKGSGQIVEFIESQYINVSTYRLLSGSSYRKLSVE